MVIVTERAKAYLKESVLSRIGAPGATPRLARTAPEELSLVPDREKEGDQVVEHQGTTVLLVDGALSSQLTGVTIDCVQSPEGSQLTVRGPDSS